MSSPHAFAPLTLHGPDGPTQTDWCGRYTPGPPEDVCGRLADDPVHDDDRWAENLRRWEDNHREA